MKSTIIRQLAAALSSGRYNQGFEYLCQVPEKHMRFMKDFRAPVELERLAFTPHGVLMELFGAEFGWHREKQLQHTGGIVAYTHESFGRADRVMPVIVAKQLGVNNHGWLYEDSWYSLTELNDRVKLSFKDIADVITR